MKAKLQTIVQGIIKIKGFCEISNAKLAIIGRTIVAIAKLLINSVRKERTKQINNNKTTNGKFSALI
jgi:hypothetical protein